MGEQGIEEAAHAIAVRFVGGGARADLTRAIATLVRRHRAATIRRGAIEIDPLARTVRLSGRGVALLPREYALLVQLAEARGPVPHAELRERVLGRAFDPGTNAIEVHVARIRAKLGRDTIETVRGHGYRLAESPSVPDGLSALRSGAAE